ncbi:hypothetical protein ACLOJK_017463 [Asimina triloba]
MADRKNKGNDLILPELVRTVEDGESRQLSRLVNSITIFACWLWGRQLKVRISDCCNGFSASLEENDYDDVNAPLTQSIELQDHVLVMETIQLPSNDQNGGSLADGGSSDHAIAVMAISLQERDSTGKREVAE